MPTTKHGDVIEDRSPRAEGGEAEGVPGRRSRTSRLHASRPGPSPLAQEAMPVRAPAGEELDDPFAMHLVGAERKDLGPDGRPTEAAVEAQEVEAELAWLIEHAEWPKLRPGAVAAAARAPRARAQARRDGSAPDLSGVGSVVAVDQLAASVKDIQQRWPSLDLAARKAAFHAAVDGILVAANVPPLVAVVDVEGKTARASFNFRTWTMILRKELIAGAGLTDSEAGELCDTLAHEARHAEQYFLIARVLASRGFDGPEIARQTDRLNLAVTEQAVAIGAAELSPAEQALAARLEPALTTEVDIDDRLDADKGYVPMAAARSDAQVVLEGLRARPPTATLAQGRAACRVLRERVEDVLLKYVTYRQFSNENDSHEAGAAAALAFEALR